MLLHQVLASVGGVGQGDVYRDGQAKDIDQEMAFTALDLFAAGVATDAGGLLDGLHTLGIQNGRARVHIPTHALPLGRMQGTVKVKPAALEPPAAKMVKDRLPGWEVSGQIAPRTSDPQHIEDGAQDIPQ